MGSGAIYNSLGEFYDAHAVETFDFAFAQFKAQLRECVRDEWVNEMARLREENAKYADIKARWAEIEAERRMGREEVERVKRDAETHARYARMEELFAQFSTVAYTVTVCARVKPKCDKCGNDRRIRYKNPVTGKDMSEICPYCGGDDIVSEPEELRVYEAKMNNFYCQSNSLTVWYRKRDDKDGYLHAVDKYDDDEPFENIKRHNAYFKSRERCQAYCDWLNERDERGRKGEANNGA